MNEEFEQFWKAYPRKTGKFIAKEKFIKARQLASFEEIMAGVETYKRCKPDYADWCHPKTWLHNGRWLDEPDTEPAVQQKDPKWVKSLPEWAQKARTR